MSVSLTYLPLGAYSFPNQHSVGLDVQTFVNLFNTIVTVGVIKKFPFRIRTTTVKRYVQ